MMLDVDTEKNRNDSSMLLSSNVVSIVMDMVTQLASESTYQ